MPKTILPPVLPTDSLNLNTDGSDITHYHITNITDKTSHAGPNADQLQNVDGEEINGTSICICNGHDILYGAGFIFIEYMMNRSVSFRLTFMMSTG